MWVVASPPRWRGPQVRARWRHGAMGPSSWDPWPRSVARAVVGAKECAQIGENDLSVSFWDTCVHCCDARGVRVAMRAAPTSTSAPTTMACRRRPLGGRLSPGRENRSCASGAAASSASSPRRQPTQTPEGLFQCKRTIGVMGMQAIVDLAQENGEMVTTAQVVEAGIPRARISDMVKAGELERV